MSTRNGRQGGGLCRSTSVINASRPLRCYTLSTCTLLDDHITSLMLSVMTLCKQKKLSQPLQVFCMKLCLCHRVKSFV